MNGEVLGFSLLASILTGTLFGLAPALFASRSNPNDSLREGERGSSLGRSPARSALIAIEIALSLILLVGAGLMMKSFVRLTGVDPRFNPDHLLVFNVGLASSAGAARQASFYQQAVDRLGSVPGVQSAGAVSRLPLAGGNSSRSYGILGSTQSYEADIRVSTPEYFSHDWHPVVTGPHLQRA